MLSGGYSAQLPEHQRVVDEAFWKAGSEVGDGYRTVPALAVGAELVGAGADQVKDGH